MKTLYVDKGGQSLVEFREGAIVMAGALRKTGFMQGGGREEQRPMPHAC